jgi:cell wall-associated NlpC family hydrolase
MSPRADYFSSLSRVWELQRACQSWAGTPFRMGGRVKGPLGGVDCGNFIPAVLAEIDAIDAATLAAIELPEYDLNRAEHSADSLFHEWFRQPAVRARVRRVDEDEPHLDGDLVFPKVGRCEHHIGFRIGNHVYHVARPSGPCRQSIHDLKAERSRYRLMEAT